MLDPVRRLTASVLTKDIKYFREGRDHAGRTHFREDIRSIVGGALAAALIVAAVANIVQIPEMPAVTAVAAGLGGLAGHFIC